MRKFLLALACLVLITGPAASPSLADEASDGAIAFINALSSDVLQTMQGGTLTDEQRTAKLRTLFQRGLDLAGIGRYVLGRHWSDATAEQIGEYQSLFTAYLIGTTTRLLSLNQVESFAVVSAGRAEGGDVLVESRLELLDGDSLQWIWRVREVEGELRIVDLLKDGVSMAATYRSEFGSVAASQGVDGLIKALRSRAAVARTAAAG